MNSLSISLMLFCMASFFPNSEMMNVYKAKSLAKAAINKKYSRAKNVVIEINEWDYDSYRDRYRIKFDASFDNRDILGKTTVTHEDMYLKCDGDGDNAVLGQSGFWGFEVKWSSVYD